MERRETYATTGPRMLVRFFGGWEFEEADANTRQPAEVGYRKGVPMGGDLGSKAQAEGQSPSFLVAALKDPIGANLDRIPDYQRLGRSRMGTASGEASMTWPSPTARYDRCRRPLHIPR